MRGTVPVHRLMLHFVVYEIIWLIKTFIVNCLEVYQGYIVGKCKLYLSELLTNKSSRTNHPTFSIKLTSTSSKNTHQIDRETEFLNSITTFLFFQRGSR